MIGQPGNHGGEAAEVSSRPTAYTPYAYGQQQSYHRPKWCRLKPATHVIGGRRIEESSGTSPPGDPLDEENPVSSKQHRAVKTVATKPPLPSTSSPGKQQQQTNSPQKRKLSGKKTVPVEEISEHETESDTDDHQEDHDYGSDAGSHASASSGTTGVTEDTKKDSETKKVGVRKKRGPYKKRQKTDTTTTSPTPITHSSPRTSDRLRRNPKVRLYSFFTNQEDSSSEISENTKSTSSTRKSSVVSSASSKKKGIPTVNSSPPSPEIASPSVSPKAATSRGPIIDSSKTSTSTDKKVLESESGRGDDSKESRHIVQLAKNYFNEKPSYVKALVESKPFHLWDFSEVAQFISVVPGLEDVAETVLKEQLDGECLFFYDFQTWKKFNLKMGPALKIVKEVQTLKDIQRKCTLKKWHEDHSAKVDEEVQRLEKLIVF